MEGLGTLRVIDCTGELGPYAGRMFAGLGADVIHVEPPRGDPMRNLGPFLQDAPGSERSLPYLYYNAGKRGMTLNLETETGREVFMRLCAGADLLLESFAPGYLDALGLGYVALSAVNPRLVQVSITPFGHSGPYRNRPGSDLVCAALGGFLFLGSEGDDKPVRACDNQSYRMAEVYAAAGGAAAVFHARRSGQGQFVDVSCMEAVATALENAPQCYDLEGKVRRGRGREAGAGTIHPCSDGFVALVAVMGSNRAMWENFVGWMRDEGAEGWDALSDERWLDSAYRSLPDSYGAFCRIVESYTTRHDKMFLYEAGQARRVAITPVSDGRDLLENPQLRHQGFWKTLHLESLGHDVTYPGAPYSLGALEWRLGAPAPAFGQHTRELLLELGYGEAEIEMLIEERAVHAR